MTEWDIELLPDDCIELLPDDWLPPGIPYGCNGYLLMFKDDDEFTSPGRGLRWTKDVMSENPYIGQQLRRVHEWEMAGDSSDDDGGNKDREVVATETDASIATSEATRASLGGLMWLAPEGMHRPVLDIDMMVKAVPSSTPGHFHLFINKAMTWDQYVKLLDVMAEVGILQQGYVNASKARGYTAVRLPWVRKHTG